MQPKCSASNQSSELNTSTSSSTITQPLRIPIERFKELCLKSSSDEPKDISSVLEFFFDPLKELKVFKNDLDSLKLYLTGGYSFDEFKSKIKVFDTSSVCGLVWNVNYVAYRCRTCALSPCMSICADCFREGDHLGHDYNMFRSGAGGACDCGDECVMNPKGFCKSHAVDHMSSSQQIGPPNDLIKCAEVILSNLLYCLLQHFRSIYANSLLTNVLKTKSGINTFLDEIQPFLDMLNELCSMGTPMRKILVDYMISEDFYKQKIEVESENGLDQMEEPDELDKLAKSHKNYRHFIYENSMETQKKIIVPKKFEHIKMNICSSNSKYIVDEFLYWCIRFEFPENLVKFLLSLLPDIRYKQIFIKSFVSQYSYISILLLTSKSEHLSSRVVHISVQLFSNEAIAMKAVEESNLLPIILSTLHNMIVTPYSNGQEAPLLIQYNSDKKAVKDPFTGESKEHLVVDPDHSIMQENLYWLVISDLVNLLSHRAVALKFLNDIDLVQIWIELISYFQGMNLNIRTFGDHVQQEPTYFSSFSAELEFCSSVMWSFLQHLKEDDQLVISKQFIDIIVNYQNKWLNALKLRSTESSNIIRPSFKQLTFHLPLHRYFSAFIYNSIYQQKGSLDNLLKFSNSSGSIDNTFLADIIGHPLQLQIGFHEIHANMWVRNGMQMKGQAMTYVQNHFCTSFSDADLFLIQVLASRIDAYVFMKIFLERFHLFDWLKEVVRSRHQIADSVNSKKYPDFVIADVVEDMLEEFDQDSPNSSLTSEKDPADKPKLEPSHQVAMLVGALTVLTQVIMIKPNLCFKSYALTRTECVNLLSVFDRTFSQIEDSMPDVCSLSSAKKFIQPILNEIAEFLEPTLDSLSIGSLKQGRYKPKDSIWMLEYDPLYVMLRSVKRREFQESFDRYCQFVEKKQPSTSKVKKSLWPPFRLPTVDASPCFEYRSRIHELDQNLTKDDLESIQHERDNQLRVDKELAGKCDILNTKSLHAILLTILYEHYYTQAVTEKIFYFVVYILELGLHFSSGTNSDQQMETTSSSDSLFFDELDYNTWFKSDKIRKNLCTFVPFIMTKYERVAATESLDLPVSSVDRLNLTEEDNSEGRSHLSAVPPLKKMCSGLPSVLAEQESKQTPETAESIYATKINAKSGEKYSLKRTQNFESILSLLVKIFYRNKMEILEKEANSSNINFLVEFDFLKKDYNFEKSPEFNRIGDENDFILNLLKKSATCDKCRLNIESSLETLNKLKKQNVQISGQSEEATSAKLSPTYGEDEIKNKKIKAKARQQKLLAQMSSNQKAFLLNPSNKVDIDSYECSSKEATTEATIIEKEISGEQSMLTSTEIDENNDIVPVEETYDCCICRLTSASNTDRPIGAVTLLQSTSVLGHRENKSNKDYVKKLPLSDHLDYKEIQTDTVCWKQEEKRTKNLRECFSISSCKYSINIGWKGGVYAQMCGHYLHFDCYNSYKKTLDENLTRNSNVEYACPLCRQLANCVLPVIISKGPVTSITSSNKKTEEESPLTSLVSSSLSNSPAKLWILSSLINKQQHIAEVKTSSNKNYSIFNEKTAQGRRIDEFILEALKYRSFSLPEHCSRELTQCKNDALAIITLTTPLEFRYIDFCQNFMQSQVSPIDDDIAMFTMSVLRTQLEIDLMLKQNDETFHINSKKRRACFVPLYDVVSSHCRLMCQQLKPHVKLWLMLTNPACNLDDNEFVSDECSSSSIKTKVNEVPVLLRDPVAMLILIMVNQPSNIQKNIFKYIVSTLFNAVFVQSIISLCREFDHEERSNWSAKSSTTTTWASFKDYIANVINSFKGSNVLNSDVANRQNQNSSGNYYIKTIWSMESAKNYVKMKCLHFLKIASLLQYYLYDKEVSFNNLNSFEYLIQNLTINFNDENTQEHKPILEWVNCEPSAILNVWFKDLNEACDSFQLQTDNLLKLAYGEYHLPRLLELPYLYSDLFGYYSTKKCQFCSKIPKETGICLLCGVQICYKTHYCCDLMKDFNKRHLNMCGAGTLVILNINSTYVFIVRGKRCAPWASLYLDEHGEEDRDLRRGKPLYLNHQRYNLLQSTWRNHSFDYQSLKWYNITLFIYSN